MLYAYGAATAWPPNSYDADAFEDYVLDNYDVSKPGIQKLLKLNQRTGIEGRSLVAPYGQPLWQDRKKPPNIQDIDQLFRKEGTALAVSACRAAIAEWGGRFSDITHLVATTCTTAGSPGFDTDLSVQLGLSDTVDRTLLHGNGCAGGLSVLRTAHKIATTAHDKPATILICACELTSTSVHLELEEAETNPDPSPGAVIFSDGASAMVLCTETAPRSANSAPFYELIDCTLERLPDTAGLMSYPITPAGFKLHLGRTVPQVLAPAVQPIFERLVTGLEHAIDEKEPKDFDWALHPGGLLILNEVERALGLTKDHLRASHAVYKNNGNASSAAILAVMEQLRRMGSGKDYFIACSFGPGLMVEMQVWKRCAST